MLENKKHMCNKKIRTSRVLWNFRSVVDWNSWGKKEKHTSELGLNSNSTLNYQQGNPKAIKAILAIKRNFST